MLGDAEEMIEKASGLTLRASALDAESNELLDESKRLREECEVSLSALCAPVSPGGAKQ